MRAITSRGEDVLSDLIHPSPCHLQQRPRPPVGKEHPLWSCQQPLPTSLSEPGLLVASWGPGLSCPQSETSPWPEPSLGGLLFTADTSGGRDEGGPCCRGWASAVQQTTWERFWHRVEAVRRPWHHAAPFLQGLGVWQSPGLDYKPRVASKLHPLVLPRSPTSTAGKPEGQGLTSPFRKQ